MSIIERSLQKMASGARAAAAAQKREAPTARAPRPQTEVVPQEPARQFQQAQLDSSVLERNRVIAGVNDSSSGSAYKILRTRLLQRLSSNNWHSVGVTGTVSGEGKSLTAINLAITLARDVNTSVFLVDLDLQRPSVAAHLESVLQQGPVGFPDRQRVVRGSGLQPGHRPPGGHPEQPWRRAALRALRIAAHG